MRPAVLVVAAALGFASAFLASCGDRSGLLPGQNASVLNDDLDRIRNAVEDKRCTDVTPAVQGGINHVTELPNSVDASLARRLREGFVQLAGTAPAECEQARDKAQKKKPTKTTKTDTTPKTDTVTTPTTPTTPTGPTGPTGATGTGGAGTDQGDGG